jgi:hypothetical protein
MRVLARRQAHGDEEAFPLGVHERERYTAVARGLQWRRGTPQLQTAHYGAGGEKRLEEPA